MNSKIIEGLKHWKESVDSQIGDTEEEIKKRVESNRHAFDVRNDLKALVEYLSANELPADVQRAIQYCLSWNPFTKA